MLFHYRVAGRLDRARLTAALSAALRRHAALRAGFTFDGVDVVQHVAEAVSAEVTDARDEAEAFAVALAPFDLTKPPLLRCCRYAIGDATGIVLTIHHLVLDGWSVAVLEHDFERALRDPASLDCRSDESYAAYCQAQHACAGDAAVIADECAYWSDLLSDRAPAKLGKGSTSFGPRPAAEYAVSLDPAAVGGIFARAHAARVTPFSVVFDAFCRTLARMADADEVVVGTTVAGRAEPAYIDTVGLFARVIPFVYTGGRSGKSDLVEQQRQLWRSQARAVVPWDKLFAGDPQRARLASRWPWSITSLQASPAPDLGAPTCRLPVPRLDSKAPLLFRIDFEARDVRPTIVYQREFFDDRALHEIGMTFADALNVTVAA